MNQGNHVIPGTGHTDRRATEDSDDLARGTTVVRYRQHVAGFRAECRADWVAPCAPRDNNIRARVCGARRERRRSLGMVAGCQRRVCGLPVSRKVEYRGAGRGIVREGEVHGCLSLRPDQNGKYFRKRRWLAARSGRDRHRHRPALRPASHPSTVIISRRLCLSSALRSTSHLLILTSAD